MVTPISARIVVDTKSFTTGAKADPESTTKKTNFLLRQLVKIMNIRLLLEKGGFLKQLLKLGGAAAALKIGSGLLGAVAAGTIGAKGVGKLTERLTGGKIGFDELAQGTPLALLTTAEDAARIAEEDVDIREEIVGGLKNILLSWFGIGESSEESERVILPLPDHIKELDDSVVNATNRFNNLQPRHFGGRRIGIPVPDINDPEVIAWNEEFGGPGGVQVGDSEYTDWIVIDTGGT